MIIFDSDLHFNDTVPFDCKLDHLKGIKSLIKNSIVSAVVLVGDLTNTGSAGGCCGSEDQLSALKTQWIEPLEILTKVYITNGNHENYTTFKPVVTYIKKRHSDTRYTFVSEGVTFVSLGLYPDKSNCNWLSSLSIKGPIVLFFHYNLQGPFSDWWSNSEKEYFKQSLGSMDIKAIFTGHFHHSYSSLWNNIKVYGVGGKYYAMYSPEKVTFGNSTDLVSEESLFISFST
jgi:hypothetical protein